MSLRCPLFAFPFLLVLLSALPAQGLTLAETLSLSASHPLILPADLAIEQEEAGRLDVRTRTPDAISLEIEEFGGDFPGLSQAETTLSFKRPLTNRHLFRSRQQSVEAGIRRSQFEKERLQWEITTRIQTAFHKVMAVQALLATAHEATDLASTTLTVVSERVDAGRSPERELLQAEIELARTQAEEQKLQGDLQEARSQLARELGLQALKDEPCIGTFSPDISLPDLETLSQSLLHTHPDLRDLDLQTAETHVERQTLKAEQKPGWAVSGGVRQFRQSNTHGYVLGIETELPDSRLHRGRLASLKKREQKITASRSGLEQNLLSRLREECTRFENARRQAMDIGERILPRSLTLRSMALEAYQEGKSDLLVLLTARKDALEAGKQHVAALYNLYLAADAIEQLCGLCLVGESHLSPTHQH